MESARASNTSVRRDARRPLSKLVPRRGLLFRRAPTARQTTHVLDGDRARLQRPRLVSLRGDRAVCSRVYSRCTAACAGHLRRAHGAAHVCHMLRHAAPCARRPPLQLAGAHRSPLDRPLALAPQRHGANALHRPDAFVCALGVCAAAEASEHAAARAPEDRGASEASFVRGSSVPEVRRASEASFVRGSSVPGDRGASEASFVGPPHALAAAPAVSSSAAASSSAATITATTIAAAPDPAVGNRCDRRKPRLRAAVQVRDGSHNARVA